jgi:hypothetical protein
MRRFRQISLRWLLIIVAVLALVIDRQTKQLRSVRQLRALGASVEYRYQYDNFDDIERYSLNVHAPEPVLVAWLGANMTSTVVSLTSSEAKDPSRVAELAARLPRLRTLAIQDCALADDDLRHLTALTELRGLYLRGTSITDSSLSTLRDMRHLRVLNIRGTSLSKDAIQSLKDGLPDTRIHSGESGNYMF